MSASVEIEVIARGVALRGGAVLLCRNVKHNYFYLPGGHVELGETAAAAVIREFEEETGQRPKVGPCVLVHEHLFRHRGSLRHELNVVFHVELHSPTVGSLERKLSFEWVESGKLDDIDLRPAAMPAWLRTFIANPAAAAAWRSDDNG